MTDPAAPEPAADPAIADTRLAGVAGEIRDFWNEDAAVYDAELIVDDTQAASRPAPRAGAVAGE